MELYLQFGYGMMGHAKELIKDWKGGGAILSPRDLTQDQLIRVATEIRENGGKPLLDPQCFLHDASWHTLTAHNYFKVFQENSTGAFLGGPATKDLLNEIKILGESMQVDSFILPGLLADTVTEDWFAFQENIINEGKVIFDGFKLYATVALSEEAMRSEEQIEAIVERSENWDIDGLYIVPESPSYLVEDPNWLANLLILASGAKLLNKEVIVGYCSHQMLCLASAKVDVICSGTWLNVRSFPPAKFYSREEGDVSRRAVWYYCPQALSEYKLAMLDIAQRAGILQEMEPEPSLGSSYANALFQGTQPSVIEWGEKNAFRHYLSCLRTQVFNSNDQSFDSTYSKHLGLLDSTKDMSTHLQNNGVFGQDRDFHNIFDVNRSAMIIFSRARKQRLSKHW